jgi:GST-like protein
MIDLYYWPTPNGHKISIMLEECDLDYEVKRVDLGAGDQFEPEFLKISPGNRMPAIVDHETGVSVFESGAILMYLAEKTGRFMPTDLAGRYDVAQWLYWQVANLGPAAGQLSHYVNYVDEAVPYAHERHRNEYDRLLAVWTFACAIASTWQAIIPSRIWPAFPGSFLTVVLASIWIASRTCDAGSTR